ncbi:restriction endonuclease subunit S [Nostoc sp. FACHB-190]|uniref:restriction endonuclease subunit S n=1 Tax=Nostoc sp. FACHB-190 TaxID=2692838 RepID=UPI00168858C7|nr:restriction endonuclease subunit S [Nostoc sp. FACHB-190]MBD2302219.1 restriction endonuclease subunit S [Nostoc sp. FACHB-190]
MFPKDWDKVTLKQLLSKPIQNGYSPICDDEPNGRWILGLGALGENGLDISRKKPAPQNDSKVKKYFLSPGDFLVSRSNTLDKVGRSALFRGEIDNCAYPDLMMCFRVCPEKVSIDYLAAYLRSKYAFTYIKKSAAGTSGSMKKINKSVLEKLIVILPPIAEQKKIAEILATWDEAIAKTEKLITAKQKLRIKLIQQIFAKNDCEAVSLGNIAEIKGRIGWRGYTCNDLRSDRSDGVLVIGGTNITKDDKLDFTNSTYLSFEKYEESPEIKIKPLDIILVKTGNTIGKVAFVNRDIGYATINPNTVIIRAISVEPEYLYHWMTTPYFKQKLWDFVAIGAQPSVNQANIKSLKIPLPSRHQQVEIAKTASFMNHELELLNKLLIKLIEQKRGLMQKLLTGEWRVKIEETAA